MFEHLICLANQHEWMSQFLMLQADGKAWLTASTHRFAAVVLWTRA